MKILYSVYTNWHIKLATSLSNILRITTIGPVEINPDINLSDKIFDFRTFKSILFNINSNKLKDDISNYDIIAVSCLYFTMNNIIYSNFSSRNVFIAYDGFQNHLLNIKPTKLDIIKDYSKKIILSFFNLKYTVRKKCISGYDILAKNQYYPEISNNILSIDFYLNRKRIFINKSNFILYLSIANSSLNIELYKKYEIKVIEILEYIYNKEIKILYRENISEEYINKKHVFDRTKFISTSGEDIALALNPEIICGDVSSTLLNLKIINKQLNIYSVCLDLYCNYFEKNMYNNYQNIFNKVGIPTINLNNKYEKN
jgi:hypothetical protein